MYRVFFIPNNNTTQRGAQGSIGGSNEREALWLAGTTGSHNEYKRDFELKTPPVHRRSELAFLSLKFVLETMNVQNKLISIFTENSWKTSKILVGNWLIIKCCSVKKLQLLNVQIILKIEIFIEQIKIWWIYWYRIMNWFLLFKMHRKNLI